MNKYPTDEELNDFIARLEQESLYAPIHLKEEILLKAEEITGVKRQQKYDKPTSFFSYTLKMVAGMAAALFLTFAIPVSDGTDLSRAAEKRDDERIAQMMEELHQKIAITIYENYGGNDHEN